MPRQSAPTLHPSTQLIGKVRSTAPIASTSASVSTNECRPTTSSCQAGSLARTITPAAWAVLFTGTPWGPFEACLVASSPMRARGVTVCPTVVATIAPTPAATLTRRPRRSMAGIRGGSTVPALLWASGFSLHGISVSTSASESFAWRPYLMSGSLTPMWTRIDPMST